MADNELKTKTGGKLLTAMPTWYKASSSHSTHNVVDRGVLQAMWEELTGKVVHRDQLIIC